MNGPVLIDTGPLVAMMDTRDPHHAWAVTQLGRIAPPLLTCEAVLAEYFHLLRCSDKAMDSLRKLLTRGVLEVSFGLAGEEDALCRLLRRYADVPMSFADACLVRMSELHGTARVFTLDSNFRAYRRNSRNVIPLLMPPDR